MRSCREDQSWEWRLKTTEMASKWSKVRIAGNDEVDSNSCSMHATCFCGITYPSSHSWRPDAGCFVRFMYGSSYMCTQYIAVHTYTFICGRMNTCATAWEPATTWGHRVAHSHRPTPRSTSDNVASCENVAAAAAGFVDYDYDLSSFNLSLAND